MSDRRDVLLLFVVVLGQLVALTAQVRDPAGGNRSVLAGLGLRVTGPVSAATTWLGARATRVTESWRDRDELNRENVRLRAEIETMRRERATRRDTALELRALRLAANYQPPENYRTRVAEVVYADYRGFLRTLVVHAPAAIDGAALPMIGAPVATHEGLVGRVVSASGEFARVQLITDRASSVGAMIQRTRRHGVVRGAGETLMLDYVPVQAEVLLGDVIVTAGIDGIYPRGLRVGVVAMRGEGDELFHRLEVEAAVDFGRLDHVYLLELSSVPGELLAAETP